MAFTPLAPAATLLRRCGPFWRAGEIEFEMLLPGVADELPVIGEGAAVAVAEVLEDHLAGIAEAGWHFEECDEGGRPQGSGPLVTRK